MGTLLLFFPVVRVGQSLRSLRSGNIDSKPEDTLFPSVYGSAAPGAPEE